MKDNVTCSVGNLAVVEKADGQLGRYFERVFGRIGGGEGLTNGPGVPPPTAASHPAAPAPAAGQAR